MTSAILSKETLSKETLIRLACPRLSVHDVESRSENAHKLPCSPGMALAACLIHELYSCESSDKANLDRLLINLDAAEQDIKSLRERLKNML